MDEEISFLWMCLAFFFCYYQRKGVSAGRGWNASYQRKGSSKTLRPLDKSIKNDVRASNKGGARKLIKGRLSARLYAASFYKDESDPERDSEPKEFPKRGVIPSDDQICMDKLQWDLRQKIYHFGKPSSCCRWS